MANIRIGQNHRGLQEIIAIIAAMSVESTIQTLMDPVYENAGVEVKIFLDYKVDRSLSGNKWRKMQYNLLEAKQGGYDRIITIGGAYSNHLYAFTNACEILGMQGMALVRGDGWDEKNPTLNQLRQKNIQIEYIDRELFRNKEMLQSIYMHRFPKAYWLPEGGSNALAILGFKHLVDEINLKMERVDWMVCPVGSGGTLAGISTYHGAKSLGISAVHDFSLEDKIKRLNGNKPFVLKMDYTAGGFAKWNTDLLHRIQLFYDKYQIPLEPIYTAKMMTGLHDLIEKGFFQKGEVIVVVHTGGLQGLRGFVARYGRSWFSESLLQDEYVND